MSDEPMNRQRAQEWLEEAAVDQLYDRPQMVVALPTLAPKIGESWTEDGLRLWLREAERIARLVYGMDGRMFSPPKRNDLPVFKARYLDALITALEAEMEAGTDWFPLADKIETNLNRWAEARAPWLDQEFLPLRVERAPASQALPAQAEGQVGPSDEVEESEPPRTTSLSGARVLHALEAGPLRLMGLADAAEVPRGSISGVVDTLEGKGLVRSEWDDNGGRSVALVVAGDEAQRAAAEEDDEEEDWPDPPGAWLQRQKPRKDHIIEVLTEAGRPLSRQEVYDGVGSGQGTPAAAAKLVADGKLVATEDGWALPEHLNGSGSVGDESVFRPSDRELPEFELPESIEARSVAMRALELLRDESRTFDELRRDAGVTADLLNELKTEGLVQRVGNRYALSNEVRLKMEVA